MIRISILPPERMFSTRIGTHSFPIITFECAPDCKYRHSNPSSTHREHFGRVPSHYRASQMVVRWGGIYLPLICALGKHCMPGLFAVSWSVGQCDQTSGQHHLYRAAGHPIQIRPFDVALGALRPRVGYLGQAGYDSGGPFPSRIRKGDELGLL
jgi:hypothetical protein